MRNKSNIYSDIKRLSCRTSNFEWIYNVRDCNILRHFSEKEWENIVLDIHTDEELQAASDSEYLALYLLRDISNGNDIGFLFILVDDPIKSYVSLHGGAWNKTRPVLLCHAYMQMLMQLLGHGWKVHTTCSFENSKAMRFIDSFGFRNYHKDKDISYKYLTTTNLFMSKMYRYLSQLK